MSTQARFKGEWNFSIQKSFVMNPDISVYAKIIYIAIKSHCGPNGNTAFPSSFLLCKSLNIARDTLYKHLNELEKGGWLIRSRKTQDGKFAHTVYCLIGPDVHPVSKITVAEETDTKR